MTDKDAPSAHRPVASWLGAAPPSVAFLLFLYQAATCCRSANYFVDDPFISMRFAANLVRFGELSFNRGVPVEGYSNLLHVLLHALLFRLGGAVPPTARAIDAVVAVVFLAALLELVLLAGLFRAAPRGSRERASWYYAWILTTAGFPFAFWATAGLEAPLEGALYLAVVWTTARADLARPGRVACVAALLFGITLVRFEGILIALALSAVLARRLFREGHAAAATVLATSTVLPGAAYHVGRWLYFGSVLPNTYLAKATGGSLLGRWNAGAHYCGNAFAAIAGGLVVAALLCAARPRVPDELSAAPSDKPLTNLVVTLVATKIGLITIGGGDWMPGFRMLVPIVPFVFFLALRTLLSAPGMNSAPPRGWRAVAFAVAIPFVVRGAPLAGLGHESSSAGRVKAIPFSYVAMGKQLARSFGPNDEVAIGEAGLVPFEAQGVRFLDMFGLVDTDMARQPGGMHRRVHVAHLLARAPAAVVFAHLYTEPPFGPYQYGPELLSSHAFHSAYRRVDLNDALNNAGWALFVRSDVDAPARGLAWSAGDALRSAALGSPTSR